MRRVRYQFGSLQLSRGKTWTFRYYETGLDGKRHYRRIPVGTKAQYPTERAALTAVEALRLSVNTEKPSYGPILFDVVIERYRREELPARYSTRTSYSSMISKWIQPKWGKLPISKIRSLDVEHWLKSLTLAPKTKAHLRNLIHLLFEWARRWEITEKNPIELVRQSNMRQKTPRRLSSDEFRSLCEKLAEPCRTMAILAACLGLRIGEILGLQWQDIDFFNGTLMIQRSVYQYHVGPVKTVYSEAALPIASEILSVLQNWRSQASYRTAADWVFASDSGNVRDGNKLRAKVLQPAAETAKIGKIGWHTLRHSFATALESAGARMKVAQELMRHGNIATTMNVYTGAMERDKREAATQVARVFLPAVQ